ncbi:MAG: AlpA family transcriptional regulator [Acidobacteriales bacterium]|nr:AlpA family transcriptional regulator [Terriglobales bacterium]
MSLRFSSESEGAKSTQGSFRNESESSSILKDVIFLRLPEVKAVTGLSKTTLYTLIREKSFPAPVQVGPRAVAWVRSEVKQWAANRVLASRTAVYVASGKRMPHSVRPAPKTSSRRSA